MPSDATFSTFEKELNRLVESFGNRLAELKGADYNEAKLRDDFLNPFFRALGWDLENRAGLIQSHREVEIESRTGSGRADYLFRPDRKPCFVCEAKKPAEELPPHAQQAKRYAWTIGIRVAVLSDFEETNIYVVNGNPNKRKSDDGLIRNYHYTEYVAKARELYADVWLGFSQVELLNLLRRAHFKNAEVAVTDREIEAPHFQSVMAFGKKLKMQN